ncbi:MAG: hypothetical protein IT219_11470 [Bacteroidales bacterium]|nr:hypothetical protein [Bacteroidales bacterium]
MRTLKRSLYILLATITLCLLLRGPLYRLLVTYRVVGDRPSYTITDPELLNFIEKQVAGKKLSDGNSVAKAGLAATAAALHYTAEQNSSDPNRLIHTRTAHCVGYAAFCASVCTYLFEKHNLSDEWTARPYAGQLYVLGHNVHPYINHPFFKDHDFVLLQNKRTGEILALDPTLFDYSGISKVSF